MKRIVLALAAAAALTGCGTNRPFSPVAPAAAPDGPDYSVSGTVMELLDDATRAVANAAVELASGDQTLTTGSNTDGAFRFDRVPGGSWTLTVSKAGYVRTLTRIMVKDNSRLELFLDRTEGRRIPKQVSVDHRGQ